MRKRVFRDDHMKRHQAALLACEKDFSLLELLCEDGFLNPAELPEEESSSAQLALLCKAIRRGFLAENRDTDEAVDMLMVKKLDSLRVWTDLVDEDVHLRAPPRCA